MKFFLTIALIILILKIFLEKKISKHYNIKKRNHYSWFVNNTHKIVERLAIVIYIVIAIIFRNYLDEFNNIIIFMISTVIGISIYFELKYRKEAKLYILDILNSIMILLIFVIGKIFIYWYCLR